MKRCLLFLVIILTLSDANEIFCQLYDENTHSLEVYCESYRENVPIDCSEEINAVDAAQVIQLKMIGCDNETVSNEIARFREMRTLDLSYSEFRSLKWLKLDRLMVLNASHNELSHVPQEIIKRNADLAEMDLSYNNFEKIDTISFRGAANLLKIYLSHNFFR